jgi:ribonuclease HI
MINVYTDGSSLGNPGPGGRGAIIVEDGTERSLSGGVSATTNNRMELQAVIEVLLYFTGTHGLDIDMDSGIGLFGSAATESEKIEDKIKIYTDSTYVQK